MVENLDSTHPSRSGATALEHMEEEIRALEEPRRPWGLWVGGAVLIVAAGAAYYWLSDRSPRPTRTLAPSGAVIELADLRLLVGAVRARRLVGPGHGPEDRRSGAG